MSLGLRAPSPAPEQRRAAPRLPQGGKSKPKRLIPSRASGNRGCPASPPSGGSRACAARPVNRAQNGQVLLLRGGDAVPPPAGDQRHAARGPGLPEGRGPGDREGEGGCVCPRGAGGGGTLPADPPPTAEPCAGKSCASANPPITALLSSLSSQGWEVRVKEGWRGMQMTVLPL